MQQRPAPALVARSVGERAATWLRAQRGERGLVWLARLASVIASIGLTIPLWRGGWLLSGDHAPHIAELLDLSTHRSGWSDLAYAGFPLGVLHSPLWYGLAALVVKLGLPAWTTYLTAVTLTEVVLGLACFEVARRRAHVSVAWLASIGVQTQSLLVVGPSGILSGMWTFGLAVAFFVLLVDRLHERVEGRVPVQVAALVGAIGLTHTFAIYGVVAVVFVRSLGLVLQGADGRRQVLNLAAACALGAVSSAAYWLAASLSIDTHDIEPAVALGWPNFQIFFRPVLDESFQPLAILRERSPYVADLVLLAVCVGTLLRLGRLEARERTMFATSLGTITLVLFVVAHIAEMRSRAMFGPIPWRIMVVVRSMLLFVAVAAVPRVRLDVRRSSALLAAALALGGFWVVQRTRWLQMETPSYDTAAFAQIETLFRDVARLAPTLRGRVYVQNTHGIAPPPFGAGHPLALLPARSGVRAVGSYYSLVPFATDRWLTSFGGPLVGLGIADRNRQEIEERFDDLDAELVITTEATTANTLRGWAPSLRVVGTVGPFTMFRRSTPGFARGERPTVVSNVAMSDGSIAFDVVGSEAGDVELAVAYAQRWQVEAGPPGAYLARRRDGLMRLHVPAGSHHVSLRYREPTWPRVVSLVGWLAVLAWAYATRARQHA